MRLLRSLTILAAALFLTVTPAAAQTAPAEADFTASDGVKIHYYTAGTTGSWVVLVP